MCELTRAPIRFDGIAAAPGEVLEYISATFGLLRDPVVVTLIGFAVEGAGHECTLFPAENEECLLLIKPSDENDWRPAKDRTNVRFFIDATPIFDFLPLPDICFLDGELTAEGTWEWFVSCDGASNCSRCATELLLVECA